MLSIFKNRLGIPGAISVVALVFAMLGGAYASTDGGSGPATASKALRGKPGKPGKRGPIGPAGPPGPTGPQGPVGPPGANGSNGTNGTSATATAFGGNQHGCSDGGIEVKSAGPATFVCNGAAGALPETLPKGETLKGTWSLTVGSLGNGDASVSFQVPLAAAPFPRYIEKEKEGEQFPEDCPGTAAEPEAKEGVICYYTSLAAGNLGSVGLAPVAKYGGQLFFSGGTAGAVAFGTWAVTGS